jgi:glycosyltransferase involved in cell wall biosynthesis
MPRRTIAIMGRVLDQDDGLGVYSLNLLSQMLRLDPQTRYVLLLQTPKCRDVFREHTNLEAHVLPARSKLVWDQWIAPRMARRSGAQLIFNPKFSVPLLSGIPSVFVLQGSDWYVNPANYPWWDNLYIRLMLPLYCRRAARLLAISQATLDDLSRYANIDVSTAALSYAGVAPNFVPTKNRLELARFRNEYRLPPRYIFTVARTYHIGHTNQPPYPGGNVERLMRAYRRYRNTGGTLPLVVAGHRVEEYLRERGFTAVDLSHVCFTGLIPNARIHMAFQLAECFVLATLCESFGIPIVEAFATGCPAIVPSTCASPEIAGGAAVLVNPLDEAQIAGALTRVTSSPALRAELRAKGLERARAFTWQATAERTLDALDRIVPGPERARSITFPSVGTVRTASARPLCHTAREHPCSCSACASTRARRRVRLLHDRPPQ